MDCSLIPLLTSADGWTLCVVLFTEQQEDQELTPGMSEDQFSSYKPKYAEITAEHICSPGGYRWRGYSLMWMVLCH